jgi:small-conductance mechanosensitive channel
VDERWVRVLVTSAAWLVVLLAVRWVLEHAYATWERRHSDGDVAEAARRRTTFSFLSRIAIVLIAAIGAWSALSIFPQTAEVARALLASGAFLAVVAGLALTTPLGNLGAGVLVAFTQPVRIGDRVTVGDQTGFVEEINTIYTALLTDDEKRVFVPNTQLTTTAIVNRTIRDPRRVVSAEFPVRLGAPIDEARTSVLRALDGIQGLRPGESRVLVGDVKDGAVWLTVTASAPLHADVIQLASDLREAVLDARGEAGWLAAEGRPDDPTSTGRLRRRRFGHV